MPHKEYQMFKGLIIDDDQEGKIKPLLRANRDLPNPMHLVTTDRFFELLNEYRNNFPVLFEKTLDLIAELFRKDIDLKFLILDLDLNDKGDLNEVKNQLDAWLKDSKTILGYLKKRLPLSHIPYLIVWTHHNISDESVKRRGWDKLLSAHGIDYIYDDIEKPEDLLSCISSRIDSVQQMYSHQAELIRRESRRNIEQHPAIILFADIEGFTGLFREYEDYGLVAALVDDALRICGEAVCLYGGVIHKYIGDCLMAYFPARFTGYRNRFFSHGIIGTMLAAVEIQSNVRFRHKDPSPGIPELWKEPITINMGIAAGTDIAWTVVGHSSIKEYTMLGTPVNRAARYQGLAIKGTIILDEHLGEYLLNWSKVKGISSPTSTPWTWPKDFLDPNIKHQIDEELKGLTDNDYPLVRFTTEIKEGGEMKAINIYVILPDFWSQRSREERERDFGWHCER